MRSTFKHTAGTIGRHGVLIGTSFLAFVPFLWMLSLSIKPTAETFGRQFSLFPDWSGAANNYRNALSGPSLPLYLSNGILVCGFVLLGQLIVCIPAGYALAKLRFPGRRFLYAMVIVGLLVPQQVLAIPQFLMLSKLNLLDSYAALIVPFVPSSFGTLLFRQLAATIPDDLLFAARLDGLSEWAIVWHIVCPSMLSGTIAFSTLSIVARWNDLFWPLIAVRSPYLMPPTLGVLAFRSGESGSNYGPLMAAATIVIAPLIVMFVIGQQWIIGGLLAGRMQPKPIGKLAPRAAWISAVTIGIVLMSAVAIIICYRPVVPRSAGQELTVSTVSSAMMPAYRRISRDFEIAHPNVHVDLRMPVESYEEQIQRSVLDTFMGNRADVAFEGLNRTETIAERGIAVPLDKFIAADPAEDLQARRSLTFAQYGGRTWGLPFSLNTPVLFYNVDLVTRAGWDPAQLPKSWPEVIQLAMRIRATGDDMLGVFFDYAADGNWTYLALIESAGGELMDAANKRIAFAGPQALAALQLLHDLGMAGQLDMSREQARQAFAAGHLGIFVASSLNLRGLQKQSGGRFKIQTMPFPQLSPNGRVPVGGGAAMILTRDPAKQRLAWEYIKYLRSPDAQLLLAEEAGVAPLSLPAIERSPAFQSYISSNPAAMTSVLQLERAAPWSSFPGHNSVQISYVVRDYLRRVLTLQQSPQDALTHMRSDVEALLKRN